LTLIGTLATASSEAVFYSCFDACQRASFARARNHAGCDQVIVLFNFLEPDMDEVKPLYLCEEDHVTVTVNSEYPLGKNKFRTVTFDAICKRTTPEVLEEAQNAIVRGNHGALREFAKEILVSFDQLKDAKGNVIDGTTEQNIASFHATFPLPLDTVTAYLKNLVKSKAKN
jgi:hypothetical protein